jgi:CTP synthase
MKKNHKYIFVVGGVISGVGKGITTSSIAKILQARGFTVTAMKVDPYVNVDAGTMNPTEHGEVFVLNDGLETDQDMGNYERFLNITIPGINYMTTGRVYESVIQRERNLEYKGKCVQVVPHIPQEVIRRIKEASQKSHTDVTVVEIGGTAGEYENILFVEAIRMLKTENPDDVFIAMVSYLPTPSKVGEMKTKPTQHAVRALNSAGIQPDIIVARSEMPLDKKRKEKIAVFCNVKPGHVISAPDVESIYDIPLNFEKEKVGDIISDKLKLKKNRKKTDLSEWKKFAKCSHTAKKEINIAVIGKYFDTGDFVLSDAYISVIEAIKHASYHIGRKPKMDWLNAVDYEKGSKKLKELKKYDGILVPGGFGERGIEGKLNVIEFTRKNKIPYLGLCYGMQLLVIEFARNVAKMTDANTIEIDPNSKYPVIDIMPDQKTKLEEKDYGGSMRLGAYPAVLEKDTIAYKAYNNRRISERHRHRYEVNPKYVERLKKKGLVFSGTSPDGELMEIAELPRGKHPFFLGTQFHPEFKSRPLHPHPIFVEFIKAGIKGKK